MVFLTGASGYVGRSLLGRLVQGGERVRCLLLPDDPFEPPASPRVEVVRGDLTRLDGLDGAGSEVRTVVHAAAAMPPAPRDRMREVNVEGTRRLLEQVEGWDVERLVYLSAVSAAYRAPTAYGASKLVAEELVRRSGLPASILRLTMVHGPGGGLHFQQLVSLVRRAPRLLPVIGPGTQRLQPVALDDVIDAIELARVHPAAVGRTFGVGGATVLTFDELVDQIAYGLGARRLKVHVPLGLSRALARAFERLFPRSFLSIDAVDGITQDATLDWTEFARACGYEPASLSAGLAAALPQGDDRVARRRHSS